MHRVIKNPALAACWLMSSLAAQTTQVNLQNQSKNVNLQAAPFTAPLKSGTVLPAICAEAQLFFETTAPAGANIFGCTATNTWTAEGSGTGGGGGGSLTWELNGTVIGSAAFFNLIPGNGILFTCSTTGSVVSCQSSADTSVMASRAGIQSGATLYSPSSSGSGIAYTACPSPVVTLYTVGQVLNWQPDVNGTGGATTLNVCILGATPVKLSDGATNPSSSSIVAGKLYQVWFDGTNFRMITSG